MDYQTAFNLVVGLAAAFGGWVLRSITITLENLQRDHKEMMSQFVRRDDYRDALERIETILNRIWDRLDDKVDK
jgi:hexokinase